MNYQTFLYTRSVREDYCWHVKPEILPSAFCRLMTRFIQMREHMYDLAEISWENTLFFFKYEELNVICRILECDTDYVGRTIYSLEGLVSVNQGMRSRLSMADLVDYFAKSPISFSELEASDKMYPSLNLDEVINPLLPICMQEGIDVGLNSNGFRELMTAIAERKEDYGFIIGPEADLVYAYAASFEHAGQKLFNHYYRTSEDKTEATMDKILDNPLKKYVSVKGENGLEERGNIRLFIRIWREGKRGGGYQWNVVRNSDGMVIRGEKRSFREGIPFSELVEEQKKLKTYYMLLGYEVV